MTTTLATELMPTLSIGEANNRYQAMAQFVTSQLKKDIDYGVIPGSQKPTLLKPGAEKLCTFFRLRIPLPEIIESVKDWTGADHNGEPFFYCEVSQSLTRDGEVIAASIASCSSWESKYRWRERQRECPLCGHATIFRSKKDGGWFCWSKKGGCGASFPPADEAIMSQGSGRVPNPDVYDLVNTVWKMAQKRAFIGATLLATNASEFFTQDMEDFHREAEPRSANGVSHTTPFVDTSESANTRDYLLRQLDAILQDTDIARAEWELVSTWKPEAELKRPDLAAVHWHEVVDASKRAMDIIGQRKAAKLQEEIQSPSEG
jgi:hypothetical protein